MIMSTKVFLQQMATALLLIFTCFNWCFVASQQQQQQQQQRQQLRGGEKAQSQQYDDSQQSTVRSHHQIATNKRSSKDRLRKSNRYNTKDEVQEPYIHQQNIKAHHVNIELSNDTKNNINNVVADDHALQRIRKLVEHESFEVASTVEKVWTAATSTTIIRRLKQKENKKKESIVTVIDEDEDSSDNDAQYSKRYSRARILARYTNEEGRDSILQIAKIVYHDFMKTGYAAVEVDPDGLVQLAKNQNVTSLQADPVYIEQGEQEGDAFTADELRTLLSHNKHSHLVQSGIVNRQRRTQKLLDHAAEGHSNRNLYLDYLDSTELIPYGVQLTQADQVSYGSENDAMVCIVDTGVVANHPDFDHNLLAGANGVSNIDNSDMPWDEDKRGHGTHIAGIVSARCGNDYGVVGMGDIPTFVTRGLTDDGAARESDIVEAIEQCERAGAKVISLSLSGTSMGDPLKETIDRLYEKNVLVVAAAGNEGRYYSAYPASYNKVIAVGAIDEQEEKWYKSNYGPSIELTAPGHLVLSTSLKKGSEYTFAFYSGTSMAAPHVASAAALLMSNHQDCTITQIRYALAYTAKDKGDQGCDDYFGFGIIQVADAHDFLSNHPCEDAEWGQDIGSGQCSIIDRDPNSFSAASDYTKEDEEKAYEDDGNDNSVWKNEEEHDDRDKRNSNAKSDQDQNDANYSDSDSEPDSEQEQDPYDSEYSEYDLDHSSQYDTGDSTSETHENENPKDQQNADGYDYDNSENIESSSGNQGNDYYDYGYYDYETYDSGSGTYDSGSETYDSGSDTYASGTDTYDSGSDTNYESVSDEYQSGSDTYESDTYDSNDEGIHAVVTTGGSSSHYSYGTTVFVP